MLTHHYRFLLLTDVIDLIDLIDFICDPFMLVPKRSVADYTSYNTTCSTVSIIQIITTDLKQASHILSKWFLNNYLSNNYLKANPDIYHVVHSKNPVTQNT